MTIITFRDGIMAADRGATIDDTIIVTATPKIARDSNGVLYGCCGTWSKCSAVLEAVRTQARTGGVVDLPLPKAGDTFEILIAFPDGRLRRLTPEGEENYDGVKYFAAGTGMDFALGAMATGADAYSAVAAAIEHSTRCGGGIDMLRLVWPDAERDLLRKNVKAAYEEASEAPTTKDVTPSGYPRLTYVSAEDMFMDVAKKAE